MREAMIVAAGQEPEAGAKAVRGLLEAEGFTVRVDLDQALPTPRSPSH
jgi:hypothetical protein